MRLGRPATKFVLSPNERGTLERYTRRETTAQSLALRARIVLRCAAGDTHTAIAADLHVTQQTLGKWRRRFRGRARAGIARRAASGRTPHDRRCRD